MKIINESKRNSNLSYWIFSNCDDWEQQVKIRSDKISEIQVRKHFIQIAYYFYEHKFSQNLTTTALWRRIISYCATQPLNFSVKL